MFPALLACACPPGTKNQEIQKLDMAGAYLRAAEVRKPLGPGLNTYGS